MAITTTGGPIGAGGAVIGAQMDIRPGVKALEKVAIRLMRRVTLQGQRLAAQYMKVDTGWARGHVDSDVAMDGKDVVGRFGILTPFNMQDGANVAAYPAMQNAGIRRHRVYLFDPITKALRWGLINWCVRHGIKVWKTLTGKRSSRIRKGGLRAWEDAQSMYGPESGAMSSYGFRTVLAKHYINVWGYAWPWLDMSRNALKAEFDQYLSEQQNSMEDEWMVGMS
jgi:hypothetical protein